MEEGVGDGGRERSGGVETGRNRVGGMVAEGGAGWDGGVEEGDSEG